MDRSGKGIQTSGQKKTKTMFLQFKIRKYFFFNGRLGSTIKANEKKPKALTLL
jgi:hypothetical protein